MYLVGQAYSIKQLLIYHRYIDSDSSQLDCQILLGHVLGQSRVWLLAHDEYRLTHAEFTLFEQLLQQRIAGKPIAYIIGKQAFWGREFLVDETTLIPRPETELLIETLLDRYHEPKANVIDLGTGSGAIAISLAIERPYYNIIATDINRCALDMAKINCARLVEQPIRFVQGHWLDGFKQNCFDIIVSNPPYISPQDWHLKKLKFEPQAALVAAADGMAALTQVIKAAKMHLKPTGWLLLEHGYQQRDYVQQLMLAVGYRNIETLVDLAGQPRAILARH